MAQLVEQIPLKDKVPGSSPGGGTIYVLCLFFSLEYMTFLKNIV